MSGNVIDLQAYREKRTRPDFEGDRREHLRQRIADLNIELALLTSERERLEIILASHVTRELKPKD